MPERRSDKPSAQRFRLKRYGGTALVSPGHTPEHQARSAAGSQRREVLGIAETEVSIGHLLLAASTDGLRYAGLAREAAPLWQDVGASLPRAAMTRDLPTAWHWLETLISAVERPDPATLTPPLDLRGTAFQRAVWDALRHIPAGETRSYAQIAVKIGRPNASRAVAGACSANPVGIVVPCHRAVRADGGLGGYYWGSELKRALLAREGAIHLDSRKVV